MHAEVEMQNISSSNEVKCVAAKCQLQIKCTWKKF